MTRKLWLPLALLLAFARCRDAAAPLTAPQLAGPQFQTRVASTATLRIVRQSATAPPLEAYQVSFWAYRGTASTVAVNYQPPAGQSAGQRFLSFAIPQLGLLAGAGGAPLAWGDSVFVTLNIDPVSFDVDFQPSGVLFDPAFPASLTLWYQNANLSDNGNQDGNSQGNQDGNSQGVAPQLAIWCYDPTTGVWYQQPSTNDPTQPSVSSQLYHFSEYAVSW
jgi:hypothetical protein